MQADYCEDCKLVFGEIKDVLEDKDLQVGSRSSRSDILRNEHSSIRFDSQSLSHSNCVNFNQAALRVVLKSKTVSSGTQATCKIPAYTL